MSALVVKVASRRERAGTQRGRAVMKVTVPPGVPLPGDTAAMLP
jgi:hypothetical protein